MDNELPQMTPGLGHVAGAFASLGLTDAELGLAAVDIDNGHHAGHSHSPRGAG